MDKGRFESFKTWSDQLSSFNTQSEVTYIL